MENEGVDWYSKYELRQFISIATRWKIDAVFQDRTIDNPYSIFKHDVDVARINFEKFKKQLTKRLSNISNWKAIEIEVKHEFIPYIDHYLNWYEIHKDELEKFKPHCPYEHLSEIIKSTKELIFRNFPEDTIDGDDIEPTTVSPIKVDIENCFGFMRGDDMRKHKVILNKDDYDNLTKWLFSYFNNNLTKPEIENPIKKVNTTKGNVVYTFIVLFDLIHPTSTRPNSLFELIKACFFEFRDDDILNMKKQKAPQYYKETIKYNQ